MYLIFTFNQCLEAGTFFTCSWLLALAPSKKGALAPAPLQKVYLLQLSLKRPNSGSPTLQIIYLLLLFQNSHSLVDFESLLLYQLI